MERLEALRRRIRNLDAALLGLVAERMELAREVGQAKRAAGVPLRDFEVERRVLERASASAADLGVDTELARAVVGHLIEEACRLQEIDGEAARYAGVAVDAQAIVVVGGAGKMGRWLVRFLASQGHRVAVVDPRATAGEPGRAESLVEGLAGSDIAFVATPLGRVAETIDEIVATGFRGLMCDVASLKEHLRPALERARARGARVTSIHPMFGPGARTLAGRVICLCDCGDSGATERVAALFRATAATLVPLSLERHDRIAAQVLGLSHFVNLAFARSLAASGLGRAELSAVGSTTFQAQLATAKSVVGEDPELYFDIQRLNRFSPAVWDGFLEAARALAAEVAGEDLGAFAASMRDARAWLDESGSAEPKLEGGRPGR
jgi:chorismate mutase/prephenate dehydrogenase